MFIKVLINGTPCEAKRYKNHIKLISAVCPGGFNWYNRPTRPNSNTWIYYLTDFEKGILKNIPLSSVVDLRRVRELSENFDQLSRILGNC